jgi:outer membrane protein assembly factor BamD (BamD/ComL family)
VINAQERLTISNKTNESLNDCSSYKFDKSENFFRVQLNSEVMGAAEKYLKSFLEQCLDSASRQQAKEHLKIIQEKISETRLQIAKYYLKRFEKGKSSAGINGAFYRLIEIEKNYPAFSKMDEVFFLLVKINLAKNNFSEAERNYRRILNNYYLSSHICEASTLIRQAKQ